MSEDQPAAHRLCPHCGAPMEADQDWCLDCGTAATTRVMPPPDWKVPVLVVAGVVAAFAVALAIAVSVLSRDAERSVAAPSAAPSSSPVGAATANPAGKAHGNTTGRSGATGHSGATGASGASGSSGTSGASGETGTTGAVTLWNGSRQAYTVVLVNTDRAAAEKVAKAAAGTAGVPTGILESSKYEFFSPGFWIAWAGRYTEKPDAQKLADRLQAKGRSGYVTLVKRKA